MKTQDLLIPLKDKFPRVLGDAQSIEANGIPDSLLTAVDIRHSRNTISTFSFTVKSGHGLMALLEELEQDLIELESWGQYEQGSRGKL